MSEKIENFIKASSHRDYYEYPELCLQCLKQKEELESLSPNIQVHISHCCVKHGCKYAEEDCPVESGKYHQEFPCEDCYGEF